MKSRKHLSFVLQRYFTPDSLSLKGRKPSEKFSISTRFTFQLSVPADFPDTKISFNIRPMATIPIPKALGYAGLLPFIGMVIASNILLGYLMSTSNRNRA